MAPPFSFEDSSVPNMAGTPDVVLPIGDVSYNSTKSLHTEYLPVAMTLRMARGCDSHLANLVRDLEAKGLLRQVATGPRLYPWTKDILMPLKLHGPFMNSGQIETEKEEFVYPARCMHGWAVLTSINTRHPSKHNRGSKD
ncbi:uncharacterized protein LY79DRAFT_551816 [Colletotrichum navitas]|uniref:Uncharacterized protein n=1 Tax=Colletotrichum navitas TaxID=681940 RepID=A0AAD8Q0A8_9PEZI|nr:uncharacterized protein LY79DRAFT_551816 [Colletotrichum navitas]KAK1593422.1 hypothetical protein LY79DRAFT_551816 [Colletotrichum navitas]